MEGSAARSRAIVNAATTPRPSVWTPRTARAAVAYLTACTRAGGLLFSQSTQTQRVSQRAHISIAIAEQKKRRGSWRHHGER